MSKIKHQTDLLSIFFLLQINVQGLVHKQGNETISNSTTQQLHSHYVDQTDRCVMWSQGSPIEARAHRLR